MFCNSILITSLFATHQRKHGIYFKISVSPIVENHKEMFNH
jgi:hypothetical protein